MVDTPILSLLSEYFVHKRSTASGVAFAGGSLGGFVLPPIIASANVEYGVRGTLMILGGVWLHLLVIAAVMFPLPPRTAALKTVSADMQLPTIATKRMDQSLPMVEINVSKKELIMNANPLRRGNIVETGNRGEMTKRSESLWCVIRRGVGDYVTFLRTPRLISLIFASFWGFFSYFNVFFILPPLATEVGMSKIMASNLLSIISAVELFSRIATGYVADKLERRKIWIVAVSSSITLVAGFSTWFWLSEKTLLVYAAVFGAFGGMFAPLFLPLIMDIVPQDRIGCATGIFTIISLASVAIGTPVLGINFFCFILYSIVFSLFPNLLHSFPSRRCR